MLKAINKRLTNTTECGQLKAFPTTGSFSALRNTKSLASQCPAAVHAAAEEALVWRFQQKAAAGPLTRGQLVLSIHCKSVGSSA